jgi:hypothetical protein
LIVLILQQKLGPNNNEQPAMTSPLRPFTMINNTTSSSNRRLSGQLPLILLNKLTAKILPITITIINRGMTTLIRLMGPMEVRAIKEIRLLPTITIQTKQQLLIRVVTNKPTI